MQMKRLGKADFERLTADAETLAYDSYGVKVQRCTDGRIIKLFRLKRAWSSARLWPYARRFQRNAHRLKALGIPCIESIETYRVDHIDRDMVIYPELEGRSLRDSLRNPQLHDSERSHAFAQLARLLAALHAKGVMFRSIHFGNVLLQQAGQLALIDVADLRKRWFGALTTSQRLRNFQHMLRYPEDCDALRAFGKEQFIDLYLDAAAVGRSQERKLKRKFMEQIPLFSHS